MTTTTEPLDPPLGDRLRRLATWADQVPAAHQWVAARAIDATAVMLAELCAEHCADPLAQHLAAAWEDDER